MAGMMWKDRRGRASVLFLAVLVGLLAAVPAAAQDEPGLFFVGGLGYQRGGPGPDLVDALAQGGLDDIRPGTCAGSAPWG